MPEGNLAVHLVQESLSSPLKGATELCSNVMCSLDSSVKHLGRPNDPMRGLFTVRSTLSVTRTHLTKASGNQ